MSVTVKVATPAVFVSIVAGEMTEVVLLDDSATFLLGTPRPSASTRVTVSIEVETPSAGTDADDTTSFEPAAFMPVTVNVAPPGVAAAALENVTASALST